MSENTDSSCPSHADLVELAQARSDANLSLWDHVANCTSCQADLDTIEDSDDMLMQGLRFVGNVDRGKDDEADPPGGSIDSAIRRSPACQQAIAKALGAMSQAYWPDADHPLPPDFDEYSIVRPLGAGGMGCVYLAQHTRLNRLVALKLLSEHRKLDPAAQDRFAAEMKTIGNLSHPNVVTAHDAREIDGQAVLVMEYVEGVDLSEIALQASSIAVADACSIGTQVAQGLAYAASVGIVHRDVKPSNVRIDKSGNVKLLDLGLARLTREALESAASPRAGSIAERQVELTATGIPVGTVDYIAPEQVTDASSVGPPADIYSLGCTLYRLLAGQSPFAQLADEGAYAKMSAHVQHTPLAISSLVSGLPRPVAKLVDRMLSKSPDTRPTAEQVINVLEPHAAHADLALLVATTEA
ncbi:MAG TPA: protein kinase, partial [Planctomycetaceae bacterium]|nr:protein kinase [Planctomycetaceae bacterium]